MSEQEAYRHVPHDVDIEQALIGSLLKDNDLIDVAASLLEASHFYDALHARLFTAIIQRIAGSNTNPLTLHAVMKSDPGVIETGGQAYLEALRGAAPAIPAIKDYANIIKDLASRRVLIGIGEKIVNEAYDAPHETPSQTIAGKATEALLAAAGSYTADRTQALSVVTAGRLTAAERRLAGEAVPSITTGLEPLDKATGGLQPGDHLLIAGRSGSGKTGLAVCLGRAAAMAGAPVLAISSDMTKERWAERTLTDVDHLLRSGVSPVHYGRFRGRMPILDLDRLTEAQQIIASWDYDICDEGEITISRIRAKVMAMANRHKGKQGLLLTDFIQKIQLDKDRKDRRRDEDITAVTYAIGDIVKDVGWSAVSLAQLKNKDTDAKGKLREDAPNESDIRESGGILMAVDIGFAVHRKLFFVERREPVGRDFDVPPPEWLEWDGERQSVEHDVQLIGFKNRDSGISGLNMTLWGEMGSNAIRARKPTASQAFTHDEIAEFRFT